ncbi:serine/threonine protein kinase [Coemansia sp. IMI 203386]|nr:serine/threonine protein kinase [Coemansia sp. IMI 203386]
MAAIGMSSQRPLSIASEPTIPCTLTEQPSGELNSSASNKHPITVTRQAPLSTRTTLVTEAANNRTCALQTQQCISQDAPTSAAVADRNAVDGTLSLSIRPTGWTRSVLGESIKKLGAGTGGRVDLHRSEITNKVVAVKTLQTSQGAVHDPATAVGGILGRRALEELGIAVNVKHENIVRTFEVVVETDRKCYVVMEACSVDLLSMIQTHAATHGTCMDDDVLNGYFAQLVSGVQYLHSIGVAHRDLKLDNVCVTEQGVVKIVDFGCATLFRRRTHNHHHRQQLVEPEQEESEHNSRGSVGRQLSRVGRTRAAPYSVTRPRKSIADSGHYVETLSSGICGSDPYMAPELFSSNQYVAAKADIWALGIIYFAMRHLQFPWSVAHAQRDARFKAFSEDPGLFFDTWFPETRSSTWSSQTRFLTTHKLGKEGQRPKPSIRRILEQNPAIRTDIDGVVADQSFQHLSFLT